MDGNTRLCTATAAAALKQSFGSDGQPSSYTDLDTTEAILHFYRVLLNLMYELITKTLES